MWVGIYYYISDANVERYMKRLRRCSRFNNIYFYFRERLNRILRKLLLHKLLYGHNWLNIIFRKK